jgi:hypothetical protein
VISGCERENPITLARSTRRSLVYVTTGDYADVPRHSPSSVGGARQSPASNSATHPLPSAAQSVDHLNAASKAVHPIFSGSTFRTHSILRPDSAAE